jgi:hypothetical protein
MNDRTMTLLIVTVFTIGVMFATAPIITDNVTWSRDYTVSDNLDLQFSTFIGGSEFDLVRGMAVDANGDIYITGNTESTDFPTTEGALNTTHNGGAMEWLPIDAFVTKLSSDGQEIIYSTFLGGSGDDYGWDIAVDDQGCAYVVGRTDSSDFPTVNAYDDSHNSMEDCFVAKLSPDGSELEFSTYVGGSGDETPYSLAINNEGDCFVVGKTYSADFPVDTSNTQDECHSRGGPKDGFVFKLTDNGGMLEYSMYLGGNDLDDASDVAINGWTSSTDFPIVNAFKNTMNDSCDSFITKLNATGHLIFSTFYGGLDIDSSSAVSFDDVGQIYTAGNTKGAGFPLIGVEDPILNGTRGVFLVVLNPLGNEVIFSGILKNSSSAPVNYLTVLSEDEVWLCGSADYSIFPTTEDAFDRHHMNDEGFFAMIDPVSCTLNYSSFFGGGSDDYIHGLAVDDWGNVVGAGHTYSSNIQIHNAIQPEKASPAGYTDGFVFRLELNKTVTTTTTMSTSSTATTTTSSTSTSVTLDLMFITAIGLSSGLVILIGILVVYRKS